MAKISLIMMLLPIVFVVHEYEEIIMFRRWIDRNREELRKRFPKIESFFTRRGHLDYSTATFAVGTAHEFILISIVSCYSVWTGAYQWWFGAGITRATRNRNEHKRNVDSFTAIQKKTSLFH